MDEQNDPQLSPYAKPGPYTTALDPQSEGSFQQWVKSNKIPFDNSPKSDYDMRGYYKDNVLGNGGVSTKQSAFDGLPHFPDTYKTPYHATFSNESKYATPDAPRWVGDRLVDKKGKVVADETPKNANDPYAAIAKPARSSDPYAAIAKPVPSTDPYASIAKPAAPTIDYSHPAGLPAGQALPGFPAPPNPVHQTALGYIGQANDAASKIPGQVANQAVQNVKDLYHGAKDAAGNFIHAPLAQEAQDIGDVAKTGTKVISGYSVAKGAYDAAMMQQQKQLEAAQQASQGNYGDAALSAVRSYTDPASSVMGGDPQAAADLANKGNIGGAAWEYAIKPAAITAATEGIAQGLGELGNGLHGERFSSNNFTKMIAPGFDHPIAPYDATQRLRPIYQKEAAAMGSDTSGALDRMFSGKSPMATDPKDMPTRANWLGKGNIPEPVEGMRNVIDLSNKVVDRVHEPIDAVMKIADKDPVPDPTRSSILNDLKAEQQRAGDFGSSNYNAYNGIIKRVEDAKNFGELNQVKKDANNMMQDALHGKGPAGKAAAVVTEPVMAWQNAGNSIRQNMYPELQRYVDPRSPHPLNIAEQGRLEADAIKAREGIYKNAQMSGSANFNEITQNYLEKLGQGSLYKTHILRRALDAFPTPAGQFNLTMRRGLGQLGEGATPATTSVVPRQLQLGAPQPPTTGIAPPPANPNVFNVPYGFPQEQQVGTYRPIQVPIGKREIPNPDFNPMTGPSHFQQQQELGTTAGTIPDRVRGAQSPSRVEADQVGVGHMPPPDVGAHPNNYRGLNPPNTSFTGPATHTVTDWHYLTGSSEEPIRTMRNGAAVMNTTDPEIAKASLKNMENYPSTKEFSQLPDQDQKYYKETLEKLRGQIADYDKWKAANPVAPAPPATPKFGVWVKPGDAGKIGNMKQVRRAVRNRALLIGSRMEAQKGLKNPPGTTNGKSMQQIEDEERQLMSAPQ